MTNAHYHLPYPTVLELNTAASSHTDIPTLRCIQWIEVVSVVLYCTLDWLEDREIFMLFPLSIILVLFTLPTCNTSTLKKSIGVSFSPAGLLTPFHLGVSEYLAEIGVISPRTQLSGSSGGALAAVCAGLDIHREALQATCSVAKRCRDLGNFATLRGALDEALDNIMPEDSHEKLNNRLGDVCIAYRQCYPQWKSQLVTSFKSREDLIEVLRVRHFIEIKIQISSH